MAACRSLGRQAGGPAGGQAWRPSDYLNSLKQLLPLFSLSHQFNRNLRKGGLAQSLS